MQIFSAIQNWNHELVLKCERYKKSKKKGKKLTKQLLLLCSFTVKVDEFSSMFLLSNLKVSGKQICGIREG